MKKSAMVEPVDTQTPSQIYWSSIWESLATPAKETKSLALSARKTPQDHTITACVKISSNLQNLTTFHSSRTSIHSMVQMAQPHSVQEMTCVWGSSVQAWPHPTAPSAPTKKASKLPSTSAKPSST